ncbi:MAG: glycosyltransferase family 39 protein [Ktedonobacterales bacterium]|nr:glycosyltransferase family 39 protein [Ktedonobacterales bacterium]
MSTLTLPLLRRISLGRMPRSVKPRWYQDPWLVALIVTTVLISIAADIMASHSQTIALYSDAHSHLTVARRVLDNARPGLAQLGSVWLPLPHILMLPFIWNDFLWRTGLAGTLTDFPCFIAAALAIFLTIRRLTHNSLASFIGAHVFVLNPNILYLQSTPLSEPVLFATLAMASYYFVVWAQDGRTKYLLLTAVWAMLATIARYDGWPLFLALLVLMVIIDVQRKQSQGKIINDVVLFGMLGGLGIVLWFLWNLVLYGDPLYFAHGPFSSAQQTKHFIAEGVVATDHNLWESIRSFSVVTMESLGPVLFVLGIIGVVVFIIKRRFTPEVLATMTVLVPFPFYILAFFLGQDVMFVPHANHAPYVFYNARFGAEMVAPAGVFIGLLVHDLFAQRWRAGQTLLLGTMLVQQFLIAAGGVITIQDGQYGLSCYVARPIAAYLAQHYNGGAVLMDTYHSLIDVSVADMTFKNIIYEGNGRLWDQALADPEDHVDWIITTPGDLITAKIDTSSPLFQAHYRAVMREGDQLTLWHLNGLAPLPSRPLPDDVLQPYRHCSQVPVIFSQL